MYSKEEIKVIEISPSDYSFQTRAQKGMNYATFCNGYVIPFYIRTLTFVGYIIICLLTKKIMSNQPQPDNNPNESNSTQEQKNPDPVNILSFMEEGNLQKEFFSGQITVEEYQRRKKMLKMD